MNQTIETQRRNLSELLDPQFMARLDALDVISRKMLQGKLQGERRSKRRGQSVEFADHRNYVAGDDLRYVDWNIYGRLDQLFLKLFLEEQDLTVHIVMDQTGSMAWGEKSKQTFILKLTAALGYISLVNNNRLTISTFADGVQGQVGNMRGRNYIPRMAEFLLNGRCEGFSDFTTSCRQLAANRTGTGMMIVLSDFFFKEGYEEGLRRLMGNHYDLYAIQVLCPEEIEPELTGDLKLIDVEDEDQAEITMSGALVKAYNRNLSSFCNELKNYCNRRDAVYMLANTGDSVETVVLNYLRRIHLLR
jgi:uncharacterized protein (DUF58 family)